MRFLFFIQGDKMGKKFIIFFTCIIPTIVNATDMCARDDVMVLAFDPMVAATKSTYDLYEWAWTATFPYGQIKGDATCLSEAEGLGRTTPMGAYYGTGEYSSTFITADSGLSGTDANGAERKACWCKITHPVTGRWVLYGNLKSGHQCTTECASACGSRMTSNTVLRKAFIETIGL